MTNVGSLDRIVRIIAGIILAAVPFVFADALAGWGAWRFALVGVGAVLLGTALLRFCPAYTLFGLRTCPRS